MNTLENEKTVFTVDERGGLINLKNLATGHNYAGNRGLWRLIYSKGHEFEREIRADDCDVVINRNDNKIVLNYENLTDVFSEKVDMRVLVSCELINDEVYFNLELANNESGTVIREVFFPVVGNCKIKSGQRLIWSQGGGMRFHDIHREIMSRHSKYMMKDNYEVRMKSLYPGNAALNSYVIEDDDEGLYIASHDPSFQFTTHLMAAAGDQVNAIMIKYPFLACGETCGIKNYVLSPYSGTWHVASKKYRAWADSWYRPQPLAKQVADMNGWQRIIMRHQHGEVHYNYDQLEEIYNDGAAAGIDTLFMFGWFTDGHDAGYPKYDCDESMGGFENLKRNIEKMQAAGGKIILYFNGQLIDKNSDYYKEIGHRIAIKKENGCELHDSYQFSGNGTAFSVFGHKDFVKACPACEEWTDLLKECIDKAIDLGCDGVFFDQFGFVSEPCFDKSHGHEVPLMTSMKVKADAVKELREYARSKNPEFSFGTEWFADVIVQHSDYIHSISGGCAPAHSWNRQKGTKAPLFMFMEWFYYTFPEIRSSDREIRDDTDIERRVNHALLKGLLSDVEIYRCRKTIKETPRYSAYLKKANILRDKYRDIILNGVYHDNNFFSVDNNEVDATSFSKGNRLAIIMTQNHLESVTTRLEVPNYAFKEIDGLNDFSCEKVNDRTLSVNLNKDALAVLIFENTQKYT